jgi:hypothetical protein
VEAGEFFDIWHRFQSTGLAVEGVGKGGMQPQKRCGSWLALHNDV